VREYKDNLQQQWTEHEILETRLGEALERYQAYLDNRSNGDDDEGERALPLLEDVRDAYEALEYWDKSLAVEETIMENLLVDAGDHDDDGADDGGTDSSSRSKKEWERAGGLYRQGKLRMRMRQLGQAQKLYQQALDAYRNQLRLRSPPLEYHPDIGNVHISMAGVHYHRDRHPESLDLLREAEQHFVDIPAVANGGGESDVETNYHPDLVKCLQHQGLVHRSMQDFDSALQAYERALQAFDDMTETEVVVGESDYDDVRHEKRLGMQLDVADMTGALDRHRDALELYQRILDEDSAYRGTSKASSSVAGSSSYDSDSDDEKDVTDGTALEGVVLHNMGKHRASLGEYETAIELLTRSLALKERWLGPDSPDVAKTLNALGAVYAVTKHQNEAYDCFQRSLLIARIHARDGDGDSDAQVMFALRNLAVLKGEKVSKWGDDDGESEGDEHNKV